MQIQSEPKYIIQPISTPGDGNCFFYAFLTCLLERNSTKEEVLKCKENCSSLLTQYTLLPYCKEEVQFIISKSVENDKDCKELVEKNFDESINHPTINLLLQQILNNFKQHILTDGIWPEDWAQQYCGKLHKINIVVYMDSCKKMLPIFSIVEEWPTIILFNRSNLHWEAGVIIVKREGQEDKIIWKHSYQNIKNLLL